MSRTDKTDPFWVNVKLVETHDHRDGVCTLPPLPTTLAEFDAQNCKPRKCQWEPANWADVKWRRPRRNLRNHDDWFSPYQWGFRRRDRQAMREALAEAFITDDEDQPTTEEMEYEAMMREPHFCRTCGIQHEYVGIDYCPTHRDDD